MCSVSCLIVVGFDVVVVHVACDLEYNLAFV